jgi:hypothetical protein
MDEVLSEEAIDYIAVRRLQSAYADTVTRRAWGELDELFLPDAVVAIDKREGMPIELAGPKAVADFIATAIAGFEFFEFVILNSRVDVSPRERGAATSRMFICELRQDAASGRWTNAFGVYHDRYRRVDGRWWFEHRRYHSLARTGRDTDVFPFPAHLSLDNL